MVAREFALAVSLRAILGFVFVSATDGAVRVCTTPAAGDPTRSVANVPVADVFEPRRTCARTGRNEPYATWCR